MPTDKNKDKDMQGKKPDTPAGSERKQTRGKAPDQMFRRSREARTRRRIAAKKDTNLVILILNLVVFAALVLVLIGYFMQVRF